MNNPYQNIFTPIKIGGMHLKNRVALAPMGTRLGNTDDTLSRRMIAFYQRIAQGGTGLIITGVAAVSRDGTMGPGMNSIYHDRFISGFEALTNAVHRAGAKLAVHLMHGGLEAFPFYTRRKRLVSPSGGTFGPNQTRFTGMDLTKTTISTTAMTLADIRSAGDDFAAAARRARMAGADAVEINGAQGFLIQQFYSPHFNQRTDDYGGTFENRMRFPLEVVRKVREAVGSDFTVLFRMVATEGEGGGLDIDDGRDVAVTLEAAGVDALHVTAGRGVSPAVWSLMMPIAEDGRMPIMDQVAAIKAAVNIPVIGVQRIVDPKEAESVLAAGKADMVALGRGLIADPDWVEKAARDRTNEIRRCIGCLQGCISTQMTAGYANCLQNPEAGREERMRLTKAPKPRRVLVIGGGPAGLEAALVAGLRGHEVSLWEKETVLGGQWLLAAVPPGKKDFRWGVEWRIGQIEKLPNVTVALERKATPEMVKALAPDVVVIATGALPVIPDIPGGNSGRVVTAHDILANKVVAGQQAAVIGGGATGCETANYLGAHGKKVTLVEALPAIGAGEQPVRMIWLKNSLNRFGIRIETNAEVEAIDASGALHISRNGQKECLGTFDTIVMAVGVRCHDPISPGIMKAMPEVHVVGDAFAMPTNGLDALHHAAKIARRI